MELSKGLELWSDGTRISIDKKNQAIWKPQDGNVVVRKTLGRVVLLIGGKQLDMSTPVAVKVGLALVKNGGGYLDPHDVVVFNISGVEVFLLPETAMKIGGAILRKADHADDWQRDNLQPRRRLG